MTLGTWLRLRMDHALRLHAWLTSPDFDQEGEIQRAEAALVTFCRVTPLLAAALGAHAWLDGGSCAV